MATATASDGGGCARVRSGKRETGRRESEREGKKTGAAAWRRSGRPGVEGEDRQAGAVAARRCARAGHTPLASWREEGDDWR